MFLDWSQPACWGFEFDEGVAAVWEDGEAVGNAVEGVGEFEADSAAGLDGVVEFLFDLRFSHLGVHTPFCVCAG